MWVKMGFARSLSFSHSLFFFLASLSKNMTFFRFCCNSFALTILHSRVGSLPHPYRLFFLFFPLSVFLLSYILLLLFFISLFRAIPYYYLRISSCIYLFLLHSYILSCLFYYFHLHF